MDEDKLRGKMQEVMDIVIADVGTIRTGAANPSMIQEIVINAYGGQQSLRIIELATVTSPDAESLVVDPWDKSIIGEIKKGVEAANVGLNPSIDGEIIRISVPPLTSEDRQKFVKLLSTKIENGKIMIRQTRGEFLEQIRKSFEEKQMGEDEKFTQEKRLQEITDEFNNKLEEAKKRKESELLKV